MSVSALLPPAARHPCSARGTCEPGGGTASSELGAWVFLLFFFCLFFKDKQNWKSIGKVDTGRRGKLPEYNLTI